MEGEIKCPYCSKFYVKPVLLGCSHNLCSGCARKLQESTDRFSRHEENGSEQGDYLEIDKVSIVSETDSGVFCNSRPSSYVSTPSVHSLYLSSNQLSQGVTYGIKCPVCKKVTYLGESGFQCLPQNRALDILVGKYSTDPAKKSENVPKQCELCDRDNANNATTVCEQCEIYYCEDCRDSFHPPRGPFAKHKLGDVAEGDAMLQAKWKQKDQKCYEHTEEVLSLYCITCKMPICVVCHKDGPHINHETQAIGAMCKSHKVELSQALQALSEKAKTETEFIQKLKGMAERVPTNCADFEADVIAQCDALIETIHQRKQELLDYVAAERDMKIKIIKDQAHSCTSHLQRTTSLLYFCVEVLKESDPASFLQISNSIMSRASTADQLFFKEAKLIPRVSPEFELTLDNSPVVHAIQTMNFYQMTDGIIAPGQPTIVPDECSAENNSVTVAWQPYPGSVVEAFTLELDDGNGGDYRVVYVGPEMMCTVDGLHFNSIYNARVKCQNHAGESDYSDLISLQTAEATMYNQGVMENHLLTDTRRLLEHLRCVVKP